MFWDDTERTGLAALLLAEIGAPSGFAHLQAEIHLEFLLDAFV